MRRGDGLTREWRLRASSPVIGLRQSQGPAAFHATDHQDFRRFQNLRQRLPGAEERRSGNSPRRDFRAARAERRRQDDADQYRLRHRQAEQRRGDGRRPRHHHGLSRRPLDDRPGAAGAHHQRLREGVGRRVVQPRTVRQAAQSRPGREAAERPVAVGEEGRQDHHAVGRHEAPPHDRQGALARAGHPLPRRADRRRRRRAQARYVEADPRDARQGGDHHPDHPLHRRGRRPRRSRRHHPQGRAHPGRGEGGADEQAR